MELIYFNGATTFPLWKSDNVHGVVFMDYVFQWGHNVSVVEIETKRKFLIAVVLFQWGHNVSVVEIDLAAGQGAFSGYHFNGATTFPLWKSDFDIYSIDADGVLQWGHNVSVVEINLDVEVDLEHIDLASMGPQRFRCGNKHSPADHILQCSASMGPQRFRCGNL